ncbi:hypothetical protein ACFC1B_07355 [Streptomyces xiamenensis]|uniref:hypothetical protein n=1 Tax=Streptomyces xiamenensis TaxID=408015 RepID=UPI0035E07F20
MRNTRVFKDAVGRTLAELARLGVTMRPGAVEDIIESNVRSVAGQLGIQERSAWRYFDSAVLAQSIAEQRREHEASSENAGVGVAPLPPVGNPELALILAGVPDQLAQSGGDLFTVIVNVAVNSWMAGHIHGEDGCEGCEGSRGPAGHDWDDRMKHITTVSPDITKWFDRDHWTAGLQDSGFSVERR